MPLHQLGRPQSAIAGGLYSIQEQLTDDEESSWRESIDETLGAMKKGFTYEDEKRIQDLIAEANPEWVKKHPVLSTIAGFAGDVLTDPLNLLGIGAVRHALGGFGTASKLSKAIGKTAAGAAIASAADNPILRAFNVYTGDKKKSRDLYVKMLDEIRGSQGIIAKEQKLKKKVLKESADRLGVSVDDLERQILRQAEGPVSAKAVKATIPADLTGAARAKAQQESDDMVEMFGNFLKEEAADVAIEGGGVVKGANIQDVMLRSGDLGIEGYVPHLLSKVGTEKPTPSWIPSVIIPV